MAARRRPLAALGRIVGLACAFVVALLVSTLAAPGSANAANCALTGHTFLATGESYSVSAQTCDVYISDNSQWGGLFDTSTGDAYSFYGLGVDDFGTPTAETVSTANATYSFVADLATDTFIVKLISVAPGASTNDTLTLYTCPAVSGTICTTSRAVDIAMTIPLPPFGISTSSLPAATAGTSYSQTITATNGTAPYSFTTSSTLPAGVTLASNGALSGTPTQAGTFSITVNAADSASHNDSKALSLTVNTPTLALSPSTIPNPQVGVPYSQAVTASGGVAPYTYSLQSGTLPLGLSLSPAGVISGTPTAGGTGTGTFTVKAIDSTTGTGPASNSIGYTPDVQAATVAITPSTLPNPAVGTAYSQTISAGGGTGPYSFSVTGGALPAGLSLSTGGALTGTPTAGGTFNFTVTATDSSTGTGPYFGSQAYTLTVAAPTIVFSFGTAPSGTVGVSYSLALSASGGTGGYSYGVTSGALPAGLTLAPGGTLSGTPTAGGTFNFTVTATDSSTGGGPYSGSQPYSLTIGAPTIAVAPSTLARATAGVAYSQALSATGGTGPYSFSTSDVLPAGLTLSSSGALSGTPTETGVFNFIVVATDSSTGLGPYTGSRSYALTVDAPTIVLSPTSLASATVGAAYSQTITASGGNGTYSYAVTAGSLPAGLSLSPSGAITGTPTAGGSFNVTITATDQTTGVGAPFTGSRAYVLAVAAPAITVAPTSLVAGAVGSAYSVTVSAGGGTSPYSYAVTAGALPAGLSLSPTGVLAGTPTAGGSFNFTVTATDSSTGTGPYDGSRSYALSIASAVITVSPSSLTPVSRGDIISDSVTASGGMAPYSFAVTAGALPPGVSLSGAGELTGSSTASGTFNFTVTATDSSTGTGPYSGAQAYAWTIAAPTITVAPGLGAGVVGTSYSGSAAASGGASPYAYSVTAGSLPPGLSLNGATGAVTGTPTAGGTFNFTVTATDGSSGGGGPYSGSRAFSVTISAPTLTLGGSTTLPDAYQLYPYSQAIGPAGGGTAPYAYAIVGGALPPGLAMDATGLITGSATTLGTYSFDVKVTDSSGGTGPYTVTQTYTITVSTAVVVPTLGEWAMLVLTALLGGGGLAMLRRRRAA